MKKGTNRKEVSVRGETYAKVKAYVEKLQKEGADVTVAGFIETLCTSFFARGEKDGRGGGAARERTREKTVEKAARRGSGNGNGNGSNPDHRRSQF